MIERLVLLLALAVAGAALAQQPSKELQVVSFSATPERVSATLKTAEGTVTYNEECAAPTGQMAGLREAMCVEPEVFNRLLVNAGLAGVREWVPLPTRADGDRQWYFWPGHFELESSRVRIRVRALGYPGVDGYTFVYQVACDRRTGALQRYYDESGREHAPAENAFVGALNLKALQPVNQLLCMLPQSITKNLRTLNAR